MTAATLTLTELPTHPERGWPVDSITGTVYGIAGRWAGRALGRVGSHGYLVSTYQGRAFLLHRVVWEACVGPIPSGMVINHRNGDKLDNRLENLEVVTSGDNQRHAYATGLKTHRVTGPSNGNYKVTPEMRAAILAGLAGGETGAALAREMGVSQQTVWRIKVGRR